ncbi:hypothetical protein NL676_019279 [Syzygium grande]|nr:hypothetical protein NL676_019279 [Syzygium grande]
MLLQDPNSPKGKPPEIGSGGPGKGRKDGPPHFEKQRPGPISSPIQVAVILQGGTSVIRHKTGGNDLSGALQSRSSSKSKSKSSRPVEGATQRPLSTV